MKSRDMKRFSRSIEGGSLEGNLVISSIEITQLGTLFIGGPDCQAIERIPQQKWTCPHRRRSDGGRTCSDWHSSAEPGGMFFVGLFGRAVHSMWAAAAGEKHIYLSMF